MPGRISSDTIIGRDDVLGGLDGALAAAAAGRPSITVLAGEAGIGKTRIAKAVEQRASASGFSVLHGEAIEFGGEQFPYAPVVAALRDLPLESTAQALAALPEEAGAGLAALFPRVRLPARPPREPSAAGQGRICELLLDLLGRRASAGAPLLVTFEDMHWADRSSRDLLAFLARNLRAERIAFVVTYRVGELAREHPLRRLLAELERRPAVTTIMLTPLGGDEVARQLEAIAARPVGAELARALHARAGGNPLFVEELFAAQREGLDEVPRTATDAVMLRVGRLEPAAQRLIALVAAAGGRLAFEPLERVWEGELGAPLRAAVDAELLVREPGEHGVALRHGLVGEVVYSELVPAERSRLHRAIAAALAASGAPPAALAEQWQRAGERADALVASISAGLDAGRVHAFAEAHAQLERAIDLWKPASVAPAAVAIDRVELLARAAQAARFSGAVERAIELAQQALEGLDQDAEPLRAAALHERLGEYRFWDDAAALASYGRALALLPADAGGERARVLAAEGRALMGLRRLGEARLRCEEALAAARAAGDDLQSARARTTLGVVLAYLGEPALGEEQLRTALAEAHGAGEETARVHVHLAELLRLRGDHAGALELSLVGEHAAARLGLRASFGRFLFINAADDLLRLGRWDEAEQRLTEAERMELGLTAAALQHATAGHLHALRGEHERARAQLERGLALIAEGLPAEFVAPIHVAWAASSLAAGDPAEARAHVAAGLAAIGAEKDPFYTPPLHWLGIRAEADAAARDRDDPGPAARADELLADLDGVLATSAGAAPPDGIAHRALAAAERGRLAGHADPAAWIAAGERWDALHEPYPAAYARYRAAEAALAGGGTRAIAAQELARAHAAAAALGAQPLRDDIAALARRARLPLGADERAPVAAGPAAGLSSREADVLALLADGLTNREIGERLYISQKTVGTHVAHIFEKLGVHTRVAAAGRARQLGVLDRPR